MEACLPKVVDREPLLLTLGAAGATVFAMLVVLGLPAVDACNGDHRGLVQCVRDMAADRLDLGPDELPAAPTLEPVVAETPAPAEPAPRVAVTDTPSVTTPPVEPSRPLVPQVADETSPPATPPQVQAPAVDPAPDPAPAAPEPPPTAETPAPAEPDTRPAETIALANIAKPAPTFVPPLPPIRPQSAPSEEVVPESAPAEPDVVETPIAPPEPTTATEAPAPATPAAKPGPIPVEPPSAEALAFNEPAVSDDDEPAASEVPAALASPPEVLPEVTAPDIAAIAEPEPVQAPVTDLTAEPPVGVTPTAPEAATVKPAPEPEQPAPPAVASPAEQNVPPPDLTVAAVDPVVPEPPAAPEPMLLAPSIDAVEIDGDGNFIAGNGPAGATMRLYVDGIPVGVSPVEGGRWLVEGTDLLSPGRQKLRVEALDPLTGKVLGDATILFEGPAPAEPAPSPADEAAAPALETPANGPPPAAEPTVEVAAPAPEREPEPVPERPAPPITDAAEAPIVQPAPPPPITPVVPTGETASVTILKPSDDSSIATLPTGEASSESVVTLKTTPTAPAVVANFNLPSVGPDAEPEPDDNVTVLRAMSIGDPGAGRFVSGKAIIRRGDTLWDIAHRYYGRGIHYRTIFRANRELIARPGRIYPGQVFELPLVYDD